ncbi:MAG: hypothetical protein IJ598_03715 [Ruminococcus sp.]|jgi:hypothetical protein|nr:hypothetical protein [Ruminococcus sp.]
MSKQIKSSYTSVFDRESKDQVKSPDKLNEYIRVSTPAVWLLAAALAVVLAALIIWGTTGSVPVNTKTTGVGMRMDFNADEVNLKSEDEAYLRKTYEVKNLFCLVDSSVGMVKNLDNKEASVVFRDGRRVKGTAHIIGSYMLEDDEIHKLLDSFHVDSKWIFSRLGSGEFRYPVYVELDETLDYMYWGETADVSIVVGEQRPVELLWTE